MDMKRLMILSLMFFPWYYLSPVNALPPPEDTPEEVLRTEIITSGRSTIDNKPLTPQEYAELQAELTKAKYSPDIDPQLTHLIYLLRIRKLFQTLSPF